MKVSRTSITNGFFAAVGDLLISSFKLLCLSCGLFILGASGFAFAAALTPYRPYFVGLTIISLGLGFYFTYRPEKECAPGELVRFRRIEKIQKNNSVGGDPAYSGSPAFPIRSALFTSLTHLSHYKQINSAGRCASSPQSDFRKAISALRSSFGRIQTELVTLESHESVDLAGSILPVRGFLSGGPGRTSPPGLATAPSCR